MSAPARPAAPFNPPGYARNHPAFVDARIASWPMLRTQEQPPSAHLAQHQATSNDAENLSVAYLYDIYDYPTTGQATFNFFGRSQNAAGLNNTDTNMQQPGNVGAGVRFLVEHMWIDFIPGKYAASPVVIGVDGGVGAGVAALEALAPNTKNGGYNTSQFPFWLEETMSFSAQITFPTLITVSTLSRIGVTLKGRQIRRAS